MARALGLWSGCSSVGASKSRCKLPAKSAPLIGKFEQSGAKKGQVSENPGTVLREQ
jgi:hypothetical protein